MHIRHVMIENVRRFGAGKACVDLELPPRGWIVVAGRNGSGKTTLLKVVALALSGNFPHEYTDTSLHWLRQGARSGSSRLSLVPSAEDELRSDSTSYSSKIARDAFIVGDDWKPTFGAMTHGRQSEMNHAFNGPWNADPKGWFAAGYGANRRLQTSSTDAWTAATSREGAFLTLFREDASLVQPIRWLMDLQFRSLDTDASESEHKEAAAIVKGSIALLNDGLLGGVEVLGVNSYGLSVRQDGQDLSIRSLGAGAQVLTGLVIDMLRHMHARFGRLRFSERENVVAVEHTGVVLIDEVEAHLHVSWQQQIGPWLTKHFPNVQFIVTTHSPFICQSAEENGLILLPASGSSEPARVADAGLYNRVVNGSVDDALLSDLFGLERTHTDKAESLRDELATLEVREIRDKLSKKERQRVAELRQSLLMTPSAEVAQALRRLKGAV